MSLNALATLATENDSRTASQPSGGVSGPPKAAKKKGDSDNKKRIKSQAFKADKLVQILLEYEAIENVEDVGGLREYMDECQKVSGSPHVGLFSVHPCDSRRFRTQLHSARFQGASTTALVTSSPTKYESVSAGKPNLIGCIRKS